MRNAADLGRWQAGIPAINAQRRALVGGYHGNRRLRISRKEGHRFTASRSMVSRHVGPLLVKQDVVDFLSMTFIRQ
jgi:hypothetical protein